jgi:hypothetical protein
MSYSEALSVFNGSAGEFIGAGVSRDAYRIGSSVYKVEYDNSRGVNYSEAAASAFMRENFKIPGILWLNFILHRMPDNSFISESPFIPETSESLYYHPQYTFLFRLAQSVGIGDFGANNVRVFKGFLIPIDLGYWALTGKRFWEPDTWITEWERKRFAQDDAEQWH